MVPGRGVGFGMICLQSLTNAVLKWKNQMTKKKCDPCMVSNT